MIRHRTTGARTASVVVTALVVTAAGLFAGGLSPAAAATRSDRTSAAEARRVDRVPTPTPAWFGCTPLAEGATCATVQLPLDYDHPNGPTTGVAVLRLQAKDQAHKIGTLFLNPGGPGGSGVQIAAAAPFFLGPEVLARFDIVGFDPRGTNFSDSVRCWPNLGAQDKALTGITSVAFPWTTKEKSAYVASSKAFGKACSTRGRPLSGSMSTAEVARDMDVLRRAVGDRQLTYLGFSYGTQLGTVYANMFPDRVRAITIDGVIDPVAWVGTSRTRGVPQTARLRSGEGAAQALHEILQRCDKAGAELCPFAEPGDPVTKYAEIVTALKRAPVVITDPDTGETFTVSYTQVVGILLGMLYAPSGADGVSAVLTDVYTALHAPPAESSEAKTDLARRLTARRAAATQEKAAARAAARTAFPYAFPYDNSPEAFQSVVCTDGLNPRNAADWPKYAAAADRSAPDFGPLWTWSSSPCASSTWTVRDEDSYTGPFTRRTANPVLVVGSLWDPATNYDGAVKVASLLPNSRLLSSDNWGHTAFGTSACVTTAVEKFLLTKVLPPRNTRCVGDVQPFETPAPASPPVTSRSQSRTLPPVVPLLPEPSLS